MKSALLDGVRLKPCVEVGRGVLPDFEGVQFLARVGEDSVESTKGRKAVVVASTVFIVNYTEEEEQRACLSKKKMPAKQEVVQRIVLLKGHMQLEWERRFNGRSTYK